MSRIASLDSPFLLRGEPFLSVLHFTLYQMVSIYVHARPSYADNIPHLTTHPDYDLFDSTRRSHSRSSAKNTERKGKAVTTMLRHDPQDDTKDNSDIGRGKGKGKGKGKAKVRARGTSSSPKATASISKALEDAGPHVPGPSSTLLQAPVLSFTSATPDASPGKKSSRRSASEPTSGKTSPGQSSVSKGKRKAEDVEGTPPDNKKEMQRATFAKDPRRESFVAAIIIIVLFKRLSSSSFVRHEIKRLITTPSPRASQHFATLGTLLPPHMRPHLIIANVLDCPLPPPPIPAQAQY